MKKAFLGILLCGMCSVTAMAQNLQDRWYVQLLGGVNNTGTENMSIGSFDNNLGFGASLSLGYMINPYLSVNAQVAYDRLHSNTGNDSEALDKNYGFNSIEPSLNVAWNLTNTFLGYKENRHHTLNLFAGVVSAFSSQLPGGYRQGYFSHNHTSIGYRAGLEYVYHLKKGWGLVAQGAINSFPDQLEGYTNGGMDSHVNLMVGVRKSFGKKAGYSTIWNDKEVRERVVTEVKREQVVVDRATPKDMYAIFFEIDKIIIRDSEVSKIQALANYLQANPKKVVFVFGYADDNTGTKARNVWLAKNRARVISEELVNKYGIDASRIISHDQGDKVQPYPEEEFEKNRATVCVVTDLER